MEQTQELRYYFNLLWRYRVLILGCTLLSVLAAWIFVLRVEPVYRAEATVRVNAAVIRPAEIDPFSGMFLSREAVKTYIQLVQTPPVLDQVAENLDLRSKSLDIGKVSAAQIEGTEFFRISVARLWRS